MSVYEVMQHNIPQEEFSIMGNDQVVERASGSQVWMEGDPEPYTDFVMGYSAANFGHMNPEISSALQEASADNVVFFDSRVKRELALSLGKMVGLEGAWDHYYPVGGAMAVEAAARACLLARPDGALVSFNGAFHGYSGVSRSLTDPAFLRQDAFTDQAKVIHAPRPQDGSLDEALTTLDSTIASQHVSGVFIEPVQGASGFNDMGADFLKGIREICTDRDVPMVADEIQSAFFRHGEPVVSTAHGVEPDILLLGKSLGGGIVPLSAVIAKHSFMERVPVDGAAFDSTFSGWPLGVTVGRRVVSYVLANDFKAEAAQKGKMMDEVLDDEISDADLRAAFRRTGMGLAYDGASKAEAEAVRVTALDQRVIVQTTGLYGDKCKISPAITIPDELLVSGMQTFARAVKAVRGQK